jgi:hypothetical protein
MGTGNAGKVIYFAVNGIAMVAWALRSFVAERIIHDPPAFRRVKEISVPQGISSVVRRRRAGLWLHGSIRDASSGECRSSE